MTAYRIPLSSVPQRLSISLAGVIYNLTLRWNRFAQAWMLDISDINFVPMINGIPLVTGANLLAQYAYKGIGGQLIAQTDNSPLDPPSFTNLGSQGNLYFVVV